MQIRKTNSTSIADFLTAVFWRPAFIVVMVMWLFYWLEMRFDWPNSSMGLYPRRWEQFYGVFLSPLLHGSLKHLLSNSFPILILGSAIGYFYSRIAAKVYILTYILSGVLTWFFAREAFHIGASGVVYAWAFFVFFSGLFRGHPSLIALSLLIAFLYGSLVWGILPVDPEVSYESHGFGGVAGLLIAWWFRKENPEHIGRHFWQRKRYEWNPLEEELLEQMDYWKTPEQIANQQKIKHVESPNSSLDSSSDRPVSIVYTFREKN